MTFIFGFLTLQLHHLLNVDPVYPLGLHHCQPHLHLRLIEAIRGRPVNLNLILIDSTVNVGLIKDAKVTLALAPL